MKTKKRLLLSTLATTALLGSSSLYANSATQQERTPVQETPSKDLVFVPYIFSTDSTGFTGGVGVIKQGFLQKQTTAIATLFYGTEQDIVTNGQADTANFSGGFAAIFDYLIPGSDRLLFSAMGLKSYFPKARYYLENNRIDSDDEAYTETSGDSDFIYATIKYVLPMGDGLDNPEGHYRLKNGFAVGREGYGGGTPFVTGRTSLGLSFFYEHNSFKNTQIGAPKSTDGLQEWDTNGLRFFIDHDNTDFDLNPSRGYQFRLQYSADFGWGDSMQTWDFLEFKYNHYINLPTFSFTQQNVLATSFWTGYSFSWDPDATHDRFGYINAHRPPPWEGARLGGMFRMRGYNTDRFSDRAVIYGAMEYRAILEWNPFRKSDFMPVAVDWLQIAPFIEAGSVNENYSDLFDEVKFDAGIGLRAMVAQTPVRLDIAYSEEGVNFWVMVFQPFDF